MREKSRKFIIPLLLTVIYAVFIYAISDSVIYAINDDRYMSCIVSGIVSGIPDGHAIYMNYVYTYILSKIYVLFPGFDWYGISMQFFMWFAFYCFLYRVINRKNKIEKVFATIAIVFLWQIVFIKYVLMFEFTIVSAITGAAMLFWVMTMEPELDYFDRVLEYIILLALGVITFCVRENVFYMLLPFLMVGLVYRFGRYKIKYYIMPFVILGVLLLGFTGIHKYAYANEDWTDFLDYNSDRSSVYDYTGLPEYYENEEFYKTLGVNYEEYVCLTKYTVALDYSTNIEEILERASEYSKSKMEKDVVLEFRNNIDSFFNKFKDLFLLNIMVSFSLINSITLLLALHKKKQKELLTIAIILGVMLAEWGYLVLGGRFPVRVLTGGILYGIAGILGILFNMISIDKCNLKKQIIKPMLVICFVLCVWSVSSWDCVQEKKSAIKNATYEYDELMQYCRNNSENFYISLGGDFGASTKILRLKEVQTGLNYTGTAGWSIYVPCENEKLERHGIETIEKAMLYQENVYVMHGNTSRAEAVRLYLDKKYGQVVWELKDVFVLFGEEYKVYKLSVIN